MTRFASFRLLAFAALIALFGGVLSAMPFTPPPAHAASAATQTGGLFVSATSRIWDTTNGRDGAPTTPMTAGHWYTVGVEGVEGMPTSGVSAVQVDLYVTNPSSGGAIHADKTGVASPNTSVTYVNYGSASVSNGATIAVGADGKIQVMATTSTDLRIDVQGYYTAGTTAPGGYVATPAIPVQTLPNIQSSTYNTFNVVTATNSPVPATASAVMLNIQESGAHATGYLIPYTAGATRPSTALYWPSTKL